MIGKKKLFHFVVKELEVLLFFSTSSNEIIDHVKPS